MKSVNGELAAAFDANDVGRAVDAIRSNFARNGSDASGAYRRIAEGVRMIDQQIVTLFGIPPTSIRSGSRLKPPPCHLAPQRLTSSRTPKVTMSSSIPHRQRPDSERRRRGASVSCKGLVYAFLCVDVAALLLCGIWRLYVVARANIVDAAFSLLCLTTVLVARRCLQAPTAADASMKIFFVACIFATVAVGIMAFVANGGNGGPSVANALLSPMDRYIVRNRYGESEVSRARYVLVGLSGWTSILMLQLTFVAGYLNEKVNGGSTRRGS